MGQGRWLSLFSDAAFKLNKGDFTKTPVKTQFGFHIIYVEDKKPAQTISFDEVKEKIKQQLKLEKFQQKISKKANELKKSAKIEKKI